MLNSVEQSTAGRIDKVRTFLEKEIGWDKFFNTYEMMYNAMDSGHNGI